MKVPEDAMRSSAHRDINVAMLEVSQIWGDKVQKGRFLRRRYLMRIQFCGVAVRIGTCRLATAQAEAKSET
jgi:hypothetical protein